MANKKLPGGRKSAGRISTSAQKLVSLKAGAVGVAISELPAAEELTGAERFPVVQGKETRGATVEQVKNLIPAGDAGESAYEIWAKAQPEGADSSEAAYLEYMQGKPGKDGENGADGLSAYQIWAEAQEDGEDISEAAYMAFQEGKQGQDGKNGENGASAYDLWVKAQPEGADTSEEAFVDFMSGKPGKDGENGADGLSAYQIWVEAQGDAEDTSEAAYLAFQEGKQGREGENGASAYDVWVMLQPEGADTSEEAFIDFISGKPGKDGENGDDGLSAYQIWAGLQEEGADTSESAYIAFQAGKKGDGGASAYQIWLDVGNEGSEEDFLEWLKVTASVEIDPLASNIAKMNSNGLYVNGAHPVIPKMVSATLTGELYFHTDLPDGTDMFYQTINLDNPLGITQLGSVSLSTQFCFEPAYYYLDGNNAHVPYQIYPTEKKISSSTVELTFLVVMAATPKRAFKLVDHLEVQTAEGAKLPFKTAVQMLIGTTLSQNGME